MYDIVTIGSATRDAFFQGVSYDYHKADPHSDTGESLCLPLGSKLQASNVIFTNGGAGTNTPVTFARQGFETAAIVRVGEDISGKEITKNLHEEGVNTSMLQIDREKPTSYSVVLMGPNAERTILVFEGAGGHLEADKIPWESLETAWIYLDSISGNIDIMKHATQLKEQKGVKLAWNPGSRDLALGVKTLRPFLFALDIFIANQEEISGLVGIPYEQDVEIFRSLGELTQGIAIMTKGPQGVIVSDGKEHYEAGTFPEKQLVSRTGAGDAFGSGFLAGFLRGGLSEGIRVGSANSTSVVEHVGAKAGILHSEELADPRWHSLVINHRSL